MKDVNREMQCRINRVSRKDIQGKEKGRKEYIIKLKWRKMNDITE